MSWSDTRRSRRVALPRMVLVAGLGLGLLGGCGHVQPLYGSFDGKPSVTVADMRQVDIAPINSRLGQKLRNELVFGLTGGSGSPDRAVYRLTVRVNDASVPVGIERNEDLPAAYLQQLNATFALTEIATQKTLTTGTSFANAAYDTSNQRFANLRAKRDAEDRAATVIAGDIRTKLAAYFATRAP